MSLIAPQHAKYWLTLVWAGAIVQRARKEGRIREDFAFHTIIKEINKFRAGCGVLMSYDWISVPLVYTQVVTLAVYTFFLASLMGRQFLDPAKAIPGHEADMVVPVFTFLQFFFYMGWFKVAEALINPFGEDDDDFESNYLIDRDLQVSYLIVDEMHAEHPELVRDQFWEEGVPDELPYTLAAQRTRTGEPWAESTADITMSPRQSEFLKEESEEEIIRGFDTEDICLRENCEKSLSSSQMMASLEQRRNESTGSILRMFANSKSSSRNDLQRIESGVSVISSAIRRKRKKSKNSSVMSDRKSSHPFLRRIPTDASEFHPLTESGTDSEEELINIKGFHPNALEEIAEVEMKEKKMKQNTE